MRDAGVARAIAGSVPDSLVDVLVALTHLGDPALFMVAAPLAFWFGPRYGVLTPRNAARVLAITIGGLSLVVGLKASFALPRPPVAVARIVTDGYGFPSGHTTGATVFYGSLAALASRWSRSERYAAAGALVALVAFTRVALGVHYVVDVVAGVVLGSLFVWTGVRASRDGVRRAFALAVAAGLFAVAAAWTVEAATAFGATLGGLLAWTWTREDLGTLRAVEPRHAAALVPVVAVGGLPLALHPDPVLAVVAGAIMGVGVVGVPTRLQNFSR